MSECDSRCKKQRRDVRAVGHDSNGEPDSPDLCFVCRVEWDRNGRVYDVARGRYVETDLSAWMRASRSRRRTHG